MHGYADRSRGPESLRAIKDPDLHKDIVALGFVKNIRIDGSRVALTIELTTPACPVKDMMRDQARTILLGLGASTVDVEMTAQVRSAVARRVRKGAGRRASRTSSPSAQAKAASARPPSP